MSEDHRCAVAPANAFGAVLAAELQGRAGVEELGPTLESKNAAQDVAATTVTADEFAPGSTIGEYKVVAQLGAGGMGVVYSAVHSVIGKQVAIKVINRDLYRDPSSRAMATQRFVQEAQAVNRARNPHLIDIFGFGALPDGRPYFVMELLDGVSFGARLRKEPRLSTGDALAILVQVADALDSVHAAGVIHRDMKPDNIQVVRERPPQAKLLDFGIAKLVEGPSVAMSSTGELIGTPLFMSPEQCRGEPATLASDLYSFGCIAFLAFTGQLPFHGTALYVVYTAHISLPPPKPRSIVPTLPVELEALVLRCLAKNPEDRPGSARELREELEAVRAALPESELEREMPLAGLSPIVPRGSGRRRWAVAAAVLACAASIGVAVGLRHPTPPPVAVAAPVVAAPAVVAPVAVAQPVVPAPVVAAPAAAPVLPSTQHARARRHEAPVAAAPTPVVTPAPTPVPTPAPSWNSESALPPTR